MEAQVDGGDHLASQRAGSGDPIGADVAMTSLALLRHDSVPYANRDEPAPFEQANNWRTVHSWRALV